MSRSDEVLRPLGAADLAAATALSTSVGWNQTLADWRRLHAVTPAGCLGAWRGPDLVGTATLVDYGGRVAWLGMVIVAASERGRGLGGRLVEAALATGGDHYLPGPGREPAGVIGLDATDLGAPLYERAGFVTVATIDRWRGYLRPDDGGTPLGAAPQTRQLTAADHTAVAALDLAVAGVDRSALLAHLLREDDVVVFGAHAGPALTAFAVLRPGREAAHLGPLVGSDAAGRAAALADAARYASGAPVLVDAVRSEASSELLAGAGLSVARTLRRMTRPGRRVMMTDGVVAATAFEWG